jgi:plastocyanin
MKLICATLIAAGATVVTAYPGDGDQTAPATLAQPVVSGRVVFEGELPLPEPVEANADGQAKLEGDKPETKPLTIDPEKSKGCVHEGSVDDQDRSLMISKDGGVANVVIEVMVDGAEVMPKEEPYHLDQHGCRFEPHVVVVPVGATVEFLNSDEISHNVHTYAGKNDNMNKLIAAGAKESQTYTKADRVEIKCDIHPWMNSFLIVSETPYFAVSDENGKFSLEGLPAGEHKVEYWHEKLGKGNTKVTVGADGKAGPIEITLSAEKKSGGRRRR